jgi:hypothetical protein
VLPRGLQPGVIVGVVGGLAVVIGCLTTWANVGALGGFSLSYPGTHFGEGRVTLALAAVAVFVALAGMVERRLLFVLPVFGGAALALTLFKRSEIADTLSVSFRCFHIVSASAGGGLDLAIAGSALLVIAAAPGLLSRKPGDEIRTIPRGGN